MGSPVSSQIAEPIFSTTIASVGTSPVLKKRWGTPAGATIVAGALNSTT